MSNNKIAYCPMCGEILTNTLERNRGRVKCEVHGEMYIDIEP